jgi:hypothetical protein
MKQRIILSLLHVALQMLNAYQFDYNQSKKYVWM